MTEKTIFKMPIGDWSEDGHGKCDYFRVQSDLPLEEVRETHFNILEKTGIDLSKLCANYEDSKIPFETIQKLIELGFNTDGILDEALYNKAKNSEDSDVYDENSDGVYSEDIASIWIFLLNKTNENLNLKMIDDEKEKMLVFYGFDEKGRHIKSPGYGVFYG